MTPEEKRAKVAEYQRAYREANREKLAERAIQRNEASRDKKAEWARIRYKANREKVLKMASAWYEANREKVLEARRIYREVNRDEVLAKKRLASAYACESLPDHYVARLIGLPVKSVPHRLIEAKREQVLTSRCLKQLYSTLKEKEKT